MKIIEIDKQIIWCPSQIHIRIQPKEDPNEIYQIYARWRHGDPWSIHLSLSDEELFNETMIPLDARKWTQNDDIDEIVAYMISETEKVLEELQLAQV